jgi:hypothetical protein
VPGAGCARHGNNVSAQASDRVGPGAGQGWLD